MSRLATRCLAGVLATAAVVAAPAGAQETEDVRILRLEATPIGALPPIALPMPASRDHNYWAFRFQAGHRIGRRPSGPDLVAIAGGIDLQWRGGSIFGVTGGYQSRDCDVAGPNCGGHALFGARGRFNVITGGPTIASFLGDYSATSTLGAEVGIGFAPRVLPDVHACTLDLGLPLSVAMLQRVRLVTYLTPGVVWDIDCSDGGAPTGTTYLASAGVGVQQLFLRGLDLYVGIQKIFHGGTGYQFGASMMYVILP